MTKKILIIYLFLALQSFTNLWSLESSKIKDSIIHDSAAYLGQTPPGDSAIVFAPGFISTESTFVQNSAFSPDGKEFYFTITNNRWDHFEIMSTKFKNGKWTIPVKADFFEKKLNPPTDEMEPFFAPGGNRIYFSAGDAGNLDIWYCEKKGEIWGEPIKLPEPVNSPDLEWYPSVSKKNTLFFARNGEIYYSLSQNGNFTNIVNIGNPVNTIKHMDGDPYISPNEDYLIFLSIDRSGGYGQGDLYISFKKETGSWTNPKNLGPKINTAEFEFGPSVTPDGKYFMFSRRKQWLTDTPSKIYWIKSDFVDLLKHTNYVPSLNNKISDQSYAVGQLFSYTIPDGAFIDDDGNNTLTYSAVLENGDSLPSWLSFNPGTRTFSGTPNEKETISIKIIATDAAGAVALTTFTLTATNADENLKKTAVVTANPQIKGTYFGQKPPGEKPEIFAPGIISLETRLETYPTFSPDGKEMFFSVVNAAWTEGRILYTRLENGVWTKPEAAPFSDDRYINWELFISPDGKRMFFASNRPPSSGMDIWMVERTSDTSWSAPVHLPDPINSAAEDGSPCVTINGTLYFKSLRSGGIGGSWLYRAILKDGAYTQIESLGNIIKTTSGETEPYMAPDESYLILISQTRIGGKGGWDLWISFQDKDGSWTEPVNLGLNINTADDEYGPRVTPDGKYLFFTREKRGKTMDIYWMSTKVIDKLRTERNNK